MRNRTRTDEDHREPSRQREQETGRVRVPKIQYRFLKEVEEAGVNGEARMSALTMAEKIKRYPLEAQHVMGSWERFTKKAIEEFKANRGDNAERDRQHVSYAILFSAVRDAPASQSIGDLKQRIDVFSARHPPSTVDRQRTNGAPAPARQQELLDRERPALDRQIDTTLVRLRELSPQLRATIEDSARELLVEGHYTAQSAREALPDAIRELKVVRSERNTVHVFALAAIAKTAEQKQLLDELKTMPRDQRKEVEAEARARLERYPPLETGIADVRKDAVGAAVRDAVDPSGRAHRDAVVLAQAREEIEAIADPRRMSWQNVGDVLASDLP